MTFVWIIIAVFALILFVRFFALNGKRNIHLSKDAVELIAASSDGFAGFKLGDSFAFVISRIKHLRLMDNDKIDEIVESRKMFGYSMGVSVVIDNLEEVKDVYFSFDSNDRVKCISIYLPARYDTYCQYQQRISSRFGKPYEGKTGDSVSSYWGKYLSLNLFDRDTDKAALQICILAKR